jgi:hypothetical protein
VDLAGIEPATSYMPWNDKNRNLLTANALIVGRVGKTAKIGVFCYQNATKTRATNLLPNWIWAEG